MRRILRQLEKRGILKQESRGRGPGNAAVYSFVGFSGQKADIGDGENRTFSTVKADIGDGENRTFSTVKADIGEPRINRVRAHEKELKKQPNQREEEQPLDIFQINKTAGQPGLSREEMQILR